MKIRNFLALCFIITYSIALSQEITVTAEKSSFDESQTNKISANLSAAASEKITVFFQNHCFHLVRKIFGSHHV